MDVTFVFIYFGAYSSIYASIGRPAGYGNQLKIEIVHFGTQNAFFASFLFSIERDKPDICIDNEMGLLGSDKHTGK